MSYICYKGDENDNKKVLNNNAALAVNSSGKEIIVMGKGLAFQKKKGDSIKNSSVEKTFQLKNETVSNQFQELLLEIPLEYIELTYDIVSNAKIELGSKLNETIYISLSDHIYNAIKRYHEGIMIKNALLWDIKRFYNKEYDVAKKTIDVIEKNIGVRLPDDEIGFIALHFVNAEDGDFENDTYQVTKIMQEIVSIVRYHFKIEFDEESVYYYRFITHLKFFAKRLTNNKLFEDDDDDNLIEIIKLKYSISFKCVEKIEEHLEVNYNYKLSDEEKMYLTIHIHKITNKE